MFSRRRFLGMTACAGMALNSSFSLANSAKSQGSRSLHLRNLHTNEAVNCTYWVDGSYQLEALLELDHCLRDHRSGDTIAMDPLLLDQLHTLQNSLDHGGEIHIISGYRSPASNAKLAQQSNGVAKKSLHMQGRAIDLRLPKRDLHKVRKAALSMGKGGVGYYPKSNFLHLDTGRFRHWG